MSWTFSAQLRRPDLRSILGKTFSLSVGAFSVHTVMSWSSIALVLRDRSWRVPFFLLSWRTNLFSLVSLMFLREKNPGRTFRIRFNPPESEWEETHTHNEIYTSNVRLTFTSWKKNTPPLVRLAHDEQMQSCHILPGRRTWCISQSVCFLHWALEDVSAENVPLGHFSHCVFLWALPVDNTFHNKQCDYDHITYKYHIQSYGRTLWIIFQRDHGLIFMHVI